MNLQKLSDEELLSITHADVKSERLATTKVLNDILEIDRRKLFLARGFESLFKFVMDVFEYSESETQTRIQAMRLLRSVPEVETKITNGSLSLTNASKLQSFFYQEIKDKKKYTQSQKLNIVNEIENKSKKDCEKILFSYRPAMITSKELVKQVSENLTHLEFNVDQNFVNDLQEFKNLVSHQLKSGNLNEVFSKMLCLALESERKNQKRPKAPTPDRKQCLKSGTQEIFPEFKQGGKNKNTKFTTRYIPCEIKREVMARAKQECEYVDPLTHKKCCSQFKLTLDHIQPLSKGGESLSSNLRILCEKHNHFMAFKILGRTKMEKYFLK